MRATTEAGGDLYGESFYIVCDLNRGDRINSRGLQLSLSGVLPGDAEAYTQYVWLNVRKQVRLKDGILTCYYE